MLIAADLIVIAVTWSALVAVRTVRPVLKCQRHMKLTYVMLEKSLIYVVWVLVLLLARYAFQLTKMNASFLRVMVTMNILHLAFSISSVSTKMNMHKIWTFSNVEAQVLVAGDYVSEMTELTEPCVIQALFSQLMLTRLDI